MAIDLAFRLKSHVYHMLTENLLWEHNDQLETWKLHIDTLADAQQTAKDHQQETFKDAQEELARSRERAMLVFEIFSAVALSWAGAVIERVVMPRFTTRTIKIASLKKQRVINDLGAKQTLLKPFTKVIHEENELVNKAFGDAAHELGGILLKLGAKPTPPGQLEAKRPDTRFAESGVHDWNSFRTGLLIQLYNQQVDAQTKFRALANNVERDVQLGEKLVAILFKQNPHLVSAPDPVKERAGQEMINKSLNQSRAEWAKNWLYYGFVPAVQGTILFLPDQMEAEMWCAWLLEEDLRAWNPLKEPPLIWSGGSGDFTFTSGPGTYIKGKSELFMTESVLNKLSAMYAPVMWFLGVEGHFDSASWIKLNDQEQMNLAKSKLDVLLEWATNHHPTILFGGEPRKLVPIEEYTTPAYPSYRQK